MTLNIVNWYHVVPVFFVLFFKFAGFYDKTTWLDNIMIEWIVAYTL